MKVNISNIAAALLVLQITILFEDWKIIFTLNQKR